MKVEWIEFKGKKILLVDFHQCKTDEDRFLIFNQYLEEMKKVKDKALILQDFTDNFVTNELLDKAKEASKWTDKLIDKVAVLGIVGIKKVLLNSFKVFSKINITAFTTKEEALEYLIK